VAVCSLLATRTASAQEESYVCIPVPCTVYPPSDQSPVPSKSCIGRYSIPFQQAMNPNNPWSQGSCAGFPVDRAPAICIQFTDPSSNWLVNESNPRGLRTWWHAAGQAVDNPIDSTTYTGDFNSSWPFVGVGNGIPDQIEYLVWELDRVYAAGFRRIILNLPAGVAFGMQQTQNNQTYMIGMNQSLSQWWAMPSYKRSWFEATAGILKNWKTNHTDVQFGLYTGFEMSDSLCSVVTAANGFTGSTPIAANVPVRVCDANNNCTIVTDLRWVTPASGANEGRDFDPRLQSHVDYLLSALEPWRNCVFKINHIWLDASAINIPNQYPATRGRKLYGYEQLSDMPVWANSGMVLGGEAIPIIEDGTDDYDSCAVNHGPFLALGAFYDYTPLDGPNAGVSRFNRWTFQCNKTEVHYMPDTLANCAMSKLVAARERGMIVSLINQDPVLVGRVQRLYSMGNFRIADFDGDGDVDMDDYLAAYAAVNASSRAFVSYQTGDLNGDGMVIADNNDPESDWVFFVNKWTLDINGAPQYKDYGAPDYSNTCDYTSSCSTDRSSVTL
jgi:hypothetical protein